ncbi:MAG: outer membrane lipoprotein-sorting protein [Deltaproteobacteria bacterium]|nr:outer membrane lipoprotein-sorting protein [Deltaproteobacteria bacterium]
MGKLWEEATQTESVRLDFKTAVNSSGDSALYSDQRYLLKRVAQTPASQWLYLPALRRVRIVPYQPDDPLLQSHYLFYDLTTIQDFGDYHYRFIDANEQAPVIEGMPLDTAGLVPYERAVFHLERLGETYVVTEVQYVARGKEKRARFLAFREIAPGCFRPHQLVVGDENGRTEFVFHNWVLRAPEPQLLTPAHLETQTLASVAIVP